MTGRTGAENLDPAVDWAEATGHTRVVRSGLLTLGNATREDSILTTTVAERLREGACMSRNSVLLFGLGVLLGFSCYASAGAAWSGFTGMGATPLVGNPSCARYSEGAALCAGVGSNGTMLFDIYKGGSWHGWAALANAHAVASDPSCSGPGVEDAVNDYVICAARTAAGDLVVDQYANGAFASELLVNADGAIGSAPSCAPLAGRSGALGVACMARTPTSQLVATLYRNSGAWSAGTNWKLLGLSPGSSPSVLPVLSAPGCAPDNVGDVVCAWLSVANAASTVAAVQLQPSKSNGGVVWSATASLLGEGSNPPVCTDAGAVGQVACFTTGTSSALYGNEFSGGAFTSAHWAGWGGGFGGLVQAYSCADYGLHGGTTSYACGVVGLVNSGFWTNTLSHVGAPWSGWVQQGTVTSFTGSPSCFALRREVTPGQVMCVVPHGNGTTSSITGP